jgi:hypothetical protein
MESVVKLFDRLIFQRIWIIQEVVAARETLVFCGSAELTTLAEIFWGALFLRRSGLGSLIDSEHGSGENRIRYLLALCEYRHKWTLYSADFAGR